MIWRKTWFIAMFCSLCFILFSCQQISPENDPEELAAIDSVINASPDIASLETWLGRYITTNNIPGMIRTYKELGKHYREAARFTDAIQAHQLGFQIAAQACDTLEVIQALNNIGTNYRRLGILDEASTFHYNALQLCEQYKDTSFTAKKSRLISLNGIGNIFLTLDNQLSADSIFRIALAGEKELGSDLGQAINYANLGAIFEARGMPDSALVYYRYSMEHNQAAKSNLGISLCYTHFGRIFEKKGEWENALTEYRKAYDIMKNSSDRWHWLEACLALARVNISKGNIPDGRIYLTQAEETAEEMRSWEHLSEVYRLNYLCYEKLGDYRRALDHYTRSHAYADSVKNAENMNHIQNQRINYEKEKNSHEVMLMRQNFEMAEHTKNIILITSLIILFLTVVMIAFLWYGLRMKSRNQQVMRRMEKVRDSFFTNITHEFRTPLTVILGLSDHLQKKEISKEEMTSGIAIISRQGRSLLELVNQLLEISKIRSEVGDPEWRMGDAVTYIRMIIENHQAYTRQKQINLQFIPAETMIIMDFVPEYFRKIICNLLSNAIKFTPRNGRIIIKTMRAGNMLAIRIADTGCGIPETDLPHIFKAFYQGENSGTEIGTGIGLSLVRQMVESMDGRINVKSVVNEGTEFTVMLPLKHGETIWKRWIADDDKNHSIPPIPETKDMPDLQEEETILPSILVVEDNTDVSYYIGELLKGTCRLLYAGNGAEGLEVAREHMPDLIITDLMMPEMDGYELCRQVRNSDILNHIPIIIITAKSGTDERVSGLDAGADAYLEKPFNTDELNIRIAKLLEQRRQLREKYSKALHEGTEQTVKLSAADQKFLNRLNDIIYSLIANHGLNSDMIADKMFMSKSQLNRKVRTITGYNTSAYILQMRLEKSKRLLASAEESIAGIAFRCGFEDANYFTRLFKQVFNITPSQYRKSVNLHK